MSVLNPYKILMIFGHHELNTYKKYRRDAQLLWMKVVLESEITPFPQRSKLSRRKPVLYFGLTQSAAMWNTAQFVRFWLLLQKRTFRRSKRNKTPIYTSLYPKIHKNSSTTKKTSGKSTKQGKSLFSGRRKEVWKWHLTVASFATHNLLES